MGGASKKGVKWRARGLTALVLGDRKLQLSVRSPRGGGGTPPGTRTVRVNSDAPRRGLEAGLRASRFIAAHGWWVIYDLSCWRRVRDAYSRTACRRKRHRRSALRAGMTSRCREFKQCRQPIWRCVRGTAASVERTHRYDEAVSNPDSLARAYASRYEQARISRPASRSNGQMGQERGARRLDEWEALGATGWGWERRAAVFKKLGDDRI